MLVACHQRGHLQKRSSERTAMRLLLSTIDCAYGALLSSLRWWPCGSVFSAVLVYVRHGAFNGKASVAWALHALFLRRLLVSP